MKINLSFPLLAAFFLLFTWTVNGNPRNQQRKQPAKPASSPVHPFTRLPVHPFTLLWKQTDSLANLGQPKSALVLVDQIYAQAKAENNDPQLIKAIIYRIRLNWTS